MSCKLRWLAACAALATGETAGFAMPALGPVWPLAVAFAAVAALAFVSRPCRIRAAAALLLAGLALSLSSVESLRAAVDEIDDIRSGRPLCAVFEIPDAVRVFRRETGGASVSFPAEYRGIRLSVRLNIEDGEAIPSPGERWQVAGWLERADGLFGRRRTLWVRGRGAFASRVAPADARSFRGLVRAAREELARRAGLGLPPGAGAAALIRAILLGDRSAIGRDERESFAAAGTLHVFAISGLHVLLLARMLFAMLVFARLPLRAAAAAAIPVLWLYVVMVGAGPSAVRAAAMASIGFGSLVFWRRPNGVAAWSVTFLATCVLSPPSLCDIGCQLSFAVMLAIVLWADAGLVPQGGVAATLVVSLVAWAAGAPIVAHTFGRFTPGGVVANLLAVPAAAASVCAGALGLAASFVSPWLAARLNAAAALATDFMTGVSRIFAAMPFTGGKVEPWSPAVCALWYAGFAFVYFVLRRHKTGRHLL